jgi:DNA-binding XRE family transcriptional regulator
MLLLYRKVIHSLKRIAMNTNLDNQEDLLNFPTIFDALRSRLSYTIRDMSNILGISYQTARRLCSEPGTPRLSTIKAIRAVFPNINSARWRRWVYLLANRFTMDVSEELAELLSTGSIELDEYTSLADLAAATESAESKPGKACSFYLHKYHLDALSLLASKFGKSQSQILRDHIDSLVTTNKDVKLALDGMISASEIHPDSFDDILKYD